MHADFDLCSAAAWRVRGARAQGTHTRASLQTSAGELMVELPCGPDGTLGEPLWPPDKCPERTTLRGSRGFRTRPPTNKGKHTFCKRGSRTSFSTSCHTRHARALGLCV